jgi:hypothetical protein
MKLNSSFDLWCRRTFPAILAGVIVLAGTGLALAQDAGATLPPGVQDVVKLAKAGISEDIILAQVKSSAATYSLTADQIIYLTQQGVSQNVIKTLMASAPASAPVAPPAPVTAPAPVAPVAPPAASASVSAPPSYTLPTTPAPAVVVAADTSVPSLTTFQSALAPYGAWINVPGYGLCWQPTVAVTDPYWRPYFDGGHWVYTDAGWSWESDYPWGGWAFHYGRWFRSGGVWVWAPGYDYAPAWVCWRQADAYCGWAPLPPEAVFVPGLGLRYRGALALDVDFGLGFEAFNFVPYDHFWDYNLHPYLLGPGVGLDIYRRSVILNGYRVDGGRFVVEGLGRDRIALYTHHDVVRVDVGVGFGHRPVVVGHDHGYGGYGHDSYGHDRDRHGW